MSNFIKKIAQNSFWLISAEIVNSGVGFVIALLLARYLGTEGYGQLGFATSFVLMFLVLMESGFNLLLIRETSKDSGNLKKLFPTMAHLRIIISLVVLIIILAMTVLLGKPAEIIILVLLMSIWTIFNNFSSILQAIFRGFQKMHFEAIAKAVQAVSLLVLLIIAIALNSSIFVITGSYAVSALVGFLLSLIFVKFLKEKFDWKIKKQVAINILKKAWPFAATYFFINLYYYFDTVILAQITNDNIVGLYTAAYKLILLLITLRVLINGAVFPALNKIWHNSREKAVEIFHLFEKLSIAFIIPVVVGGIILAQPIINLLFGAEFINATLAFQILLIGVGIMYINMLPPRILTIADKQKTAMYIYMAGAIFNIVTNLIFIPIWGITAAAITTVLSELLIFILFYIYSNKIFKIKIIRFFVSPLASALVMGIVIYFLNDHVNVILNIIIGLIIYIIMLFITKGISRDFIKLNVDLILKK